MTDPNSSIVSARNVRKEFGNFLALNGVSLDVFPGEVVCIVGPSGSGKSTMLRMINGLEQMTAGEIVVNGINLPGSHRDLLQVRRSVGMVFQNFNLFPHLSVLQNLTIAPRRNGFMKRPDAEKKAEQLLRRMGLLEQIKKYPSQLSGGQQQRIAIARALATEPKLLLFDEPTSALDPENVSEVLNVMRELADTGITMIIVTHEMKFAREVADRIVFMASGELLVDLSPSEFFANQDDPRLSSFLSKML